MLRLRPDPGRHRRPRSHRLVGPSDQPMIVGQVITWHPADALEQSEPSSRSRETPQRPTSHTETTKLTNFCCSAGMPTVTLEVPPSLRRLLGVSRCPLGKSFSPVFCCSPGSVSPEPPTQLRNKTAA
nr:DUF1589 domain-containing protein [Rhodopirellula baltica]